MPEFTKHDLRRLFFYLPYNEIRCDYLSFQISEAPDLDFDIDIPPWNDVGGPCIGILFIPILI